MEIGAHKTVLAAAIPYFHGMFAGSSFIEAHQEKIAITDIDYQAFQLLIEYAYTARIEITEDNVRVTKTLSFSKPMEPLDFE